MILTAKQIMTTEVVTARPHHSLQVVYALMKRHGFRHVPITAEGRVLGVVSESELLLRSQVTDEGTVVVPEQSARDVMDASILSCRPYTPVANVAATMITYKKRYVLVADTILKGIITTSNILERYCFDREMDGRKVSPLRSRAPFKVTERTPDSSQLGRAKVPKRHSNPSRTYAKDDHGEDPRRKSSSWLVY